MSRAQDLFEAIRADGYLRLEQMVGNEITEELFLDYKATATKFPATSLDESDKKNFSKAISGFGNSDGGIVIWGVECRTDKVRGDVPTGMRIISNAVAFKTLLDGVVSGMTVPPHGDVETIAVLNSSSSEGMVVTHVPAGWSIPLQTTSIAGSTYYMRAGSNFLSVPHGVLSGMFGRRPQALLKGRIVPDKQFGKGSNEASIRLILELINEGRGVADDVHYSIESGQGEDTNIEVFASRVEWDERTVGRRTTIASTGKFRQVPGERIQVSFIDARIPNNPKTGMSIVGSCGTRNSPSSMFSYKLSQLQLEQISTSLLIKYDDESQQKLNEEKVFEIMKKGMVS